MRAILDVLAFLGIMVIMIAALFWLEPDAGSVLRPWSWVLAVGAAYLAHRILMWIANAKPRWQVERDRQEQAPENQLSK